MTTFNLEMKIYSSYHFPSILCYKCALDQFCSIKYIYINNPMTNTENLLCMLVKVEREPI